MNAAAAPMVEDDEPEDIDPDALNELCEDWSAWVRTRRFFGKPSLPPSILGKLRSPSRVTAYSGGPDAIASAQLAAFNLAIEQEPIEALDRQVFELHYRWRVKPIKTFADALGISRKHWYTLLRSFRIRAQAAAQRIQGRNEADRLQLRSQSKFTEPAPALALRAGDTLVLETR